MRTIFNRHSCSCCTVSFPWDKLCRGIECEEFGAGTRSVAVCKREDLGLAIGIKSDNKGCLKRNSDSATPTPLLVNLLNKPSIQLGTIPSTGSCPAPRCLRNVGREAESVWSNSVATRQKKGERSGRTLSHRLTGSSGRASNAATAPSPPHQLLASRAGGVGGPAVSPHDYHRCLATETDDRDIGNQSESRSQCLWAPKGTLEPSTQGRHHPLPQ